ncbi:MAG: NADH-quinone oxidoreductase subunit M, partial [Gammaproteobacteria bacterium]|nr:NADH-quinone oxidoreductase subunit M [Gammaproteobacteria bacterium]
MEYLINNTLSYPILTVLLVIPLVGAAVTFLMKNDGLIKAWALIVTLITAALSLPLYFNWDYTTAKYQFAQKLHWFDILETEGALDYVVGVDGISVLLVLLTTLVMPLCVLCSWTYIKDRLREFMVVMLLMEAFMIGVFISLNMVMFFIFWEAMLVPMFLLIAVWGGERKDYASIKFFLYTLFGSVLMLIAMLVLYFNITDPVTGGHTFNMLHMMDQSNHSDWMQVFNIRYLVYIALFIGFAIKIPMFPFHT